MFNKWYLITGCKHSLSYHIHCYPCFQSIEEWEKVPLYPSHHLCHRLSCHGDRVTSVERNVCLVGESCCYSLKSNSEVWTCPTSATLLFLSQSCRQRDRGFPSGGLWFGHPISAGTPQPGRHSRYLGPASPQALPALSSIVPHFSV